MFEKRKEEIGWIYYEDEVLRGNELAIALGDIENYIFDMLEEKQVLPSEAKRALKALDTLKDNIA